MSLRVAAVLLLAALQHALALAAVDHLAGIRESVNGAELVAQVWRSRSRNECWQSCAPRR